MLNGINGLDTMEIYAKYKSPMSNNANVIAIQLRTFIKYVKGLWLLALHDLTKYDKGQCHFQGHNIISGMIGKDFT